MVRSRSSPASSHALVTLITIALVIAALYFGRQVLIPLALAVVFTFLLTPVVSRLEKLRLGRIPSALLVLVLALGLAAAVGLLASGQLVEIARQLPNYQANIHKKLESLRGEKGGDFSKASTTIAELNKELTAAPPETPGAPARHQAAKDSAAGSADHPLTVQVAEAPSSALQHMRALLGSLLGPLETAGIVIVFSLFMLVKREDLRNRVIRLAGQDRLHTMTKALDDAAHRLSRYLLVQFIVNASYGILFGLGLYFIKVPHALLFGVLAAIVRYIPYLGAVIGAAFPAAMAMAVFPGWTQVILVLVLFLIIDLTIANILEPVLYGSHTGVSSLAILVAAVFWAELWGPVGLILSTPLTLCLMVMGRHILQLRFLEIAMGDEPVLSPEAHLYQRLLAKDQEEVGDIAHSYLKEQPLGNLYDAVLIPALGFAEQDRHMGVLDEDQEKFIYNCTKELVEELGEHLPKEPPSAASRLAPFAATAASRLAPFAAGADGASSMDASARVSSAGILCVPARDEADEIIAMMLAQLLQRSGYRAGFLPIGAVEDMLEQVAKQEAAIVCVSALPPFALGQARSLCRRLRVRFPKLKIVVGLWNYEGGIAKAQERFVAGSADIVVANLAQILGQVRQFTDSIVLPAGPQDAQPAPEEPAGRWAPNTIHVASRKL